jgi:hypothetical protein
MSVNSSNVLNFTQPITQTMNSSTGNYSGGSNQSLNLSYFVPINTGGTQTIGGQPAGMPQVTANGTPSYPPAGGGGYPAPAPAPYYPPAPAPAPYYPQPPAYPQPPVYQQPAPIFLLPQQPVQQNNTNMNNVLNLIINIINQVKSNQVQQQQPQPPQQQDNSFFLLLILLLKGRSHRDDAPAPAPAPTPAPVPAPAPKPAPAPAPRPPKVTIDTDQGNFKQQAQTVAKKGSPLTLDLNGDGVKTSTKKVDFDINGDGKVDSINDISADDGVLTIDSDGDGTSGSTGKELLGDNTDLSRFGITGKFADGFDALKAIADNAKAKGLINNDDILDATELAALEKEYGLKIKNGSVNAQSASITNSGIKAINLATGEKVRSNNFDGQGNDTLKQGGATFTKADGSQGNYEDIFFGF